MAAPRPAQSVTVHGDRETQAALRRFDDRLEDLPHEPAAELVASSARSLVPILGGGLLDTIRVERVEGGASVLAGSPFVPYAGVQNSGWPARNIPATHYLDEARDRNVPAVVRAYDDEVGKLIDRLDGELPR
jgi:hypothetical protein